MFNNKRPREEPIFSEAFVVGCQGPVPWQGDDTLFELQRWLPTQFLLEF